MWSGDDQLLDEGRTMPSVRIPDMRFAGVLELVGECVWTCGLNMVRHIMLDRTFAGIPVSLLEIRTGELRIRSRVVWEAGVRDYALDF